MVFKQIWYLHKQGLQDQNKDITNCAEFTLQWRNYPIWRYVIHPRGILLTPWAWYPKELKKGCRADIEHRTAVQHHGKKPMSYAAPPS